MHSTLHSDNIFCTKNRKRKETKFKQLSSTTGTNAIEYRVSANVHNSRSVFFCCCDRKITRAHTLAPISVSTERQKSTKNAKPREKKFYCNMMCAPHRTKPAKSQCLGRVYVYVSCRWTIWVCVCVCTLNGHTRTRGATPPRIWLANDDGSARIINKTIVRASLHRIDYAQTERELRVCVCHNMRVTVCACCVA